MRLLLLLLFPTGFGRLPVKHIRLGSDCAGRRGRLRGAHVAEPLKPRLGQPADDRQNKRRGLEHARRSSCAKQRARRLYAAYRQPVGILVNRSSTGKALSIP